jgi:hypothetical protein
MIKTMLNCIVFLLIVTIPSCYTVNSIDVNELKKEDPVQTVSGIETINGYIIKEREKLTLKYSKEGIIVVDSSKPDVKTKTYKFNELKSITVEKFSSSNSIFLFVSLVTIVVIGLYVFSLSQIKIP